MAYLQSDNDDEYMVSRRYIPERSRIVRRKYEREDKHEFQESEVLSSDAYAPGESVYVRSRSSDPSAHRSNQRSIEKELVAIRLRHQHSVDLLADVEEISASKSGGVADDEQGLSFGRIRKRADNYVFRLKVWLLESQLDHPRAVAIDAERLSSTVMDDILEIEDSASSLQVLCRKATLRDLQMLDEDIDESTFSDSIGEQIEDHLILIDSMIRGLSLLALTIKASLELIPQGIFEQKQLKESPNLSRRETALLIEEAARRKSSSTRPQNFMTDMGLEPHGHGRTSFRKPTYFKVSEEHLDPETLRYYSIPWEYDTREPGHIIILQELDESETNYLFEHTRKIRKYRDTEPSRESKQQYAFVRTRQKSISRSPLRRRASVRLNL